MKTIKFILYKPYLLLIAYILVGYYFNNDKQSMGEIISGIALVALNMLLFALLFFWLLKNSLLRLVNKVNILTTIPDRVLTGYLFILLLLQPILMIVLAILSKLFIRSNTKTHMDEFGNEVTQIKSFTPTVILSRKDKDTGEDEHIVMTKLKKKPKKVIYE